MWSGVEFGIETPGISLVLMPDSILSSLEGNQLGENLTVGLVWHLTVAFRRVLKWHVQKWHSFKGNILK